MTQVIIKRRGLSCTLIPRSDWRRFRYFKWLTHSATVICHNSWNTPGPYHVTVYIQKNKNKNKKSCVSCPSFQMTFIHFKLLLGAFAKLQKKWPLASSCLSVRPHGTTHLPLDEFSRKLVLEDFSKIGRKNSTSLKSEKNNGYFTWRPMYIYDNISLNSS
jgi:hypothetical protein